MVVALAAIVTEASSCVVTAIVMELEVAVAGAAQANEDVDYNRMLTSLYDQS